MNKLARLNTAVLAPLRLPKGFSQGIQTDEIIDLKHQGDLDKLEQTIVYKGSNIQAYVVESSKEYVFWFFPFISIGFSFPAATNLQLIQTTTFTSRLTARQIFYDTASGPNPVGTPLFIGRNVGFFESKEITYIGSFSAALSNETCFDIEGTGSAATSIFSPTRSGFVNWVDLGSVASMGIVPTENTITQIYAEGFQFNSPNAQSTDRVSFFQLQNPALGFADTTLSFTGTSGIITANGSEPQGLSTGESFVFLDKELEGSRVIMAGNAFNKTLGANFFRPDINKSITAMANADKSITSFQDSTQNPSTHTTCNVVNHQYWLGQVVLLADEAAYAGTHIVTWVEANSFDIEIAFSTSGSGTSKETKFTTSTIHGFLKNETVTESGTANYNAESQIVSLISTTEYTKPIAFNTDEGSGSVDSIGLTEKSIYVTANSNGDAKDSKSIGSMDANDNTTATTISTINTYVDFNLNALATDNTNIEQWTLTDTTTGELRYDGIKQFTGKVIATVSAQSSGSAQEFVFRYVRNGSPMANPIELSTELRSDTNSLTIVAPITADTGDLFRPQVKNIDGTSNIVIRFMSTEID